ncbi:PxORF117 peptide [Plutella xylostella granulovirus]|uniref:ORF115 protein n=1 Tax=Plutella xylostella granulovirus TaxID=98383 RepID=Q9DVR6_9BBAC|nr:PxORF117 peptide [Plutella xylostella granulovirus]AAG27415.1 PxORF117 peptide [Plutella xylostella granulovirus]AMQ35727.1 PxGV-Corf115 protein [Plutella xylostella granulovirus]AMQ35844.1 PxGV-Korf115 protein [Plutella xylostella granulovirus]AMQ35961.1 PxGV-Morf115 protein [Plutella xylostella granulovirus]AMQ36078.1 PxGV-Torf115 protein [Plutella xylostella granulovirus]
MKILLLLFITSSMCLADNATKKYFIDDEKVPFEYTQTLIRLYTKINNYYYHVTSYNGKDMATFRSNIVDDPMAPLIIRYTLLNYDNSKNNYVVLRFEHTKQYLCMNYCAEFYITNVLNYDCAFVMTVEDSDESDDSILVTWQRKLDDKLRTIFIASEGYSFLPNSIVHVKEIRDTNYTLDSMVDEPDDRMCTDEKVVYVDDDKSNIENVPQVAAVNVTVLIISLASIITIVGAMIVATIILHIRKRKTP